MGVQFSPVPPNPRNSQTPVRIGLRKDESVISPKSYFELFLSHLQDAEHFEEPDKEEKQKDVQSYEVKVMHFLALVLG